MQLERLVDLTDVDSVIRNREITDALIVGPGVVTRAWSPQLIGKPRIARSDADSVSARLRGIRGRERLERAGRHELRRQLVQRGA